MFTRFDFACVYCSFASFNSNKSFNPAWYLCDAKSRFLVAKFNDKRLILILSKLCLVFKCAFVTASIIANSCCSFCLYDELRFERAIFLFASLEKPVKISHFTFSKTAV